MTKGLPLALLVVLLPACSGFGPLPTKVAERLAQRAALDSADPDSDAPFTEAADVTIEAPDLSGQWNGVLAVRPGRDLAVRMQLFPDLGAKVLDLAADRVHVVALQPQSGNLLVCPIDEATLLPYEPMLFIAASLLELFEPVTLDRVLAARQVPKGHELLLRPLVIGTRVFAVVDEHGAVVHRTLQLGLARWLLTVDQNLVTAHGKGFTLQAKRHDRVVDKTLPSSTFEVQLPSTR